MVLRACGSKIFKMRPLGPGDMGWLSVCRCPAPKGCQLEEWVWNKQNGQIRETDHLVSAEQNAARSLWFPLTYVGSGRVAAVKWHLRHKLSDWLRHTFSFSHTHTDTPTHKHTPSILGTVGEIYSGNNLFVAQSDYKKKGWEPLLIIYLTFSETWYYI